MPKNKCPHCGQPVTPRADHHLIRYALDRGYTITVGSGGDEPDLERSQDEALIREAVDAVDECHLVIRDNNGGRIAAAYIVHGNAPDEEVCDHTANDWMEAWWTEYEKLID